MYVCGGHYNRLTASKQQTNIDHTIFANTQCDSLTYEPRTLSLNLRVASDLVML